MHHPAGDKAAVKRSRNRVVILVGAIALTFTPISSLGASRQRSGPVDTQNEKRRSGHAPRWDQILWGRPPTKRSGPRVAIVDSQKVCERWVEYQEYRKRNGGCRLRYQRRPEDSLQNQVARLDKMIQSAGTEEERKKMLRSRQAKIKAIEWEEAEERKYQKDQEHDRHFDPTALLHEAVEKVAKRDGLDIVLARGARRIPGALDISSRVAVLLNARTQESTR
jgi:hypothetical protein